MRDFAKNKGLFSCFQSQLWRVDKRTNHNFHAHENLGTSRRYNISTASTNSFENNSNSCVSASPTCVVSHYTCLLGQVENYYAVDHIPHTSHRHIWVRITNLGAHVRPLGLLLWLLWCLAHVGSTWCLAACGKQSRKYFNVIIIGTTFHIPQLV